MSLIRSNAKLACKNETLQWDVLFRDENITWASGSLSVFAHDVALFDKGSHVLNVLLSV